MGDYYSGNICIGGQLSRSAMSVTDPDETILQRLCDLICSESAIMGGEFGDAEVSPRSAADLMKSVRDGFLQLCDDQAPNGEFPDLEHFCREEGLPFCRESSAYGGYSAEEETWLPGMDESLIIHQLNDGTEQVSGGKVREALAFLEQNNEPPDESDVIAMLGADPQLAKQRLTWAIEILQGLCPRIITIPDFEIIP